MGVSMTAIAAHLSSDKLLGAQLLATDMDYGPNNNSASESTIRSKSLPRCDPDPQNVFSDHMFP